MKKKLKASKKNTQKHPIFTSIFFPPKKKKKLNNNNNTSLCILSIIIQTINPNQHEIINEK
jgi:hypothetical protein